METRFTHNSTTDPHEPPWGDVDKTKLPRIAHAEEGDAGHKTTWKYPHHWVKNGGGLNDMGVFTTGEMFCHRGGVIAAYQRMMQRGVKGEPLAHIQAHRKALGMGMAEPAKKEDLANPSLFYRAAVLDARAVDEEARTAPVTFSSEASVGRWYGKEILLHDAENVNLGRLQAMGSCLVNHDPNQIAGGLRDVGLGTDRRGHATILFDRDEEGDRAMAKAKSGSLRGVSVGYLIHKAKRLQENEEFDHPALGKIIGPALVATRWEPTEISLTPVPADSHVGVGRDAARSLDGIELEQAPQSRSEDSPMDERTKKYLVGRGLAATATDEEAAAFAEGLAEKDAAQAARIVELERAAPTTELKTAPARKLDENLYAQAAAAGQQDLALRLLSEGKADEEIRSQMLDAVSKRGGKPVGPAPKQPEAANLEAIPDDEFFRSLASLPIV